MKKTISFIKILLVNILLIFILDFTFSFIYYNCQNSDNKKNLFESFKIYKQFFIVETFDAHYKQKVKDNYFRNCIVDEKHKKRDLLIFGCSFGYGFLLNENQAFAYKLAHYTNRNVYNQSISSFGIQEMYNILKDYEIEEKVQDPEYIMFIMIPNHGYRLYRQIMNVYEPIFDTVYKIDKNGNLKERKCPYKFIYRFAIPRFFNYTLTRKMYDKKSPDEVFKNMKIHFENIKKLADEKYPNSKIVILKYPENKSEPLFELPQWQELKEEGFIIIDLNNLTHVDLSSSEYKIPNDVHPNEKAWNTIIPALAKKLKL